MQLCNVTKYYRGKCACRVPKLKVFAGEVTAVVGPSGAGKTTFLRICSGLTSPDCGKVRYTSHDSRGVMVFQQPNLFRGSVYYNISYGLRIRQRREGLSAAEIDCRVKQAAELVNMRQSLNWSAATLSAGEAQRVALARALVLQPPLLLLDEPTANLDPGNVKIIETALLEAVDRWRVALLLVTHNLAQARRLADQVLFFYDGELKFRTDMYTFFHSQLSEEHAQFMRGELVYE